MADRSFILRQTRKGFGPAGGDEVLAVGSGTAHDDGTVDVTPELTGHEVSMPLSDLEAMLAAMGAGFATEIVWQE